MGRSTLNLLGKGSSLDEARASVQKLEKEQARLLELKEHVESQAFVEKEVREKLGMAKEGDVVVVLPPDDVLRKLAPSLEKETFIEEYAIWERWTKMFFRF